MGGGSTAVGWSAQTVQTKDVRSQTPPQGGSRNLASSTISSPSPDGVYLAIVRCCSHVVPAEAERGPTPPPGGDVVQLQHPDIGEVLDELAIRPEIAATHEIQLVVDHSSGTTGPRLGQRRQRVPDGSKGRRGRINVHVKGRFVRTAPCALIRRATDGKSEVDGCYYYLGHGPNKRFSRAVPRVFGDGVF